MKSKLLVLSIVIILIFCTVDSFADYLFLSTETNKYLENLKEKFREKKIVLEKREGIIWTVILPKNNKVKIEEIKEAVYSDETGKFEAIYNFTYITILNPQGFTSVKYEWASRFYPYDKVKLCFVYSDNSNGTVLPSSGTPSDLENWYWLPCGDGESGSWIQITK